MLINVRQLAVLPVPVSTSKEPVLGARVGVWPLLEPPESTAEQHSADSASGHAVLLHLSKRFMEVKNQSGRYFCGVLVIPSSANRWGYSASICALPVHVRVYHRSPPRQTQLQRKDLEERKQ